ncbi:PASTA domain-containing protein, partial [Flavobacteriaceae bacterium TP-CH-4]
RTVNVVMTDATPPVITLNGANPQEIELGAGYTELGATTDDGSQVVIDATEFVDAVGSYTIYYNATDTAGNGAVEVTRMVNVVQINPTQTSVPNVVNLEQAAAETAIEDAGLVVSSIATANSDLIPSGNVIVQNPTGGTLVAIGTRIELVISLGAPCQVVILEQPEGLAVCPGACPSLSVVTEGSGTITYQWQLNGENLLGPQATNATITLDAVDVQNDGDAYACIITSDNGTPDDRSDDCSVTTDVAVLNVGPLPVVNFSALADIDLNAGIQTGLTGGLPIGGVYSGPGVTDDGNGQTYSFAPVIAGQGIHTLSYTYTNQDGCSNSASDEVVVVLDRAVVPDVVGLSEEEATLVLEGVDLTIGTVTMTNSDTVPAGFVIGQDPGEGSSVIQGAAVDLVVSAGTTEVSVPDVVTMSQEAAENAIIAAGLIVGIISYSSSDIIPAGSVVDQNPLGGTLVGIGTRIDLVISSGEETPTPSITGFILMNAITGENLMTLSEGAIIDISTLPSDPLNIRAIVSEDTGSVRWVRSGTDNYNRTDNVAPFEIFDGDGSTFIPGRYSIQATPYSDSDLAGNQGMTRTVNFEIIDQISDCATFEINVDSFQDPSRCGGTDGRITLQALGASGAVTYQWSHDAHITGNEANNLAAGTYTIIATDDDCMDTIVFILTDPPLPEVSLDAFVDVQETDDAFSLTGGFPSGGVYSGMGVENGSFNPSEVGEGTYEISYTYTDELGCSNSAISSITVQPVGALSINGFVLVDADTDEDIMPLTDGIQINLSDLTTENLTIRAEYSGAVKSVRFLLTGAFDSESTVSLVPYAIFGYGPQGYMGQQFLIGTYELMATPYSQNEGGGIRGNTAAISFEMVLPSSSGRPDRKGMIVYPNPADQKVMVSIEGGAKIQKIGVYDMLGRPMLISDMERLGGSQEYELEVAQLSPGRYVLFTINGQGETLQQQLLINR